MQFERKHIANWGNYPKLESKVYTPESQDQLHPFISECQQFIPRGNGRCYGDAALAENTLETLKLNEILEFDVQNGVIRCQSGVLLSDILKTIVPAGYFLFVSPGTKFITVGGAIAADIHGKNHHKEGSFSDFLISFRLLRSDGSILTCTKDQNTEWFWATCGGMGLTGVILDAAFRLRPVSTAFIKQVSYKTSTLDETLERIDLSEDTTYSVAWIDCLAKGEKLGRGILLNGEHARPEELPVKWKNQALQIHKNAGRDVPFYFPGFALNNVSIKVFNYLYFHRQRKTIHQSVIHYDPYFYPLDSLLHWNRIYGKKGFTQYQCVLPKVNGKKGIQQLLRMIRDAGIGSFLTVLKLMGPGHSQSPLGFPLEGYTLALDFKIQDGLFPVLDQLDRIVMEHGGRLYLAKDARMSSRIFKKTYPRSKEFADKFMKSDNRLYSALAQRLEL